MKRIVASIGVATFGAACVPSATAQTDLSRPWSASVALRGFYDDNINTTKHDKVDSFGGEVNPRLAFALRGEQTTAALVYTYGFRYFDEKPAGNTEHFDQNHTIAGSVTHNFDERTSVSVSDSFVIGQEPDQLRSGVADATFQRIPGQNVRNYGSISLLHQFAPKFGMEVGYANSLFDYEDDTYQVLTGIGGSPFGFYPVGVIPVSNSGLLDRTEHNAHVDARWTVQPATVALVGYAYGQDHYTAKQPIGVVNTVNVTNIAFNEVIYSDNRDARSHYLYAGAEHKFLPGLQGNARVGVRFTDYFNSPTSDSQTAPYVLATLTYEYTQNSSVQVGVSHDLSATDAFTVDRRDGSFTTDSQVTVAYASISHRLLPSLTGSLMGQFQNSTYNGGAYDNKSEQSYLLSASLTYDFNRHLAASLSYHYDMLDSSIPGRGFDRNRVFLGATFTY